MKKLTLSIAVLISSLSLPAFATLSSVQNSPSVRTVSELKINTSKLDQTNTLAALAQNEVVADHILSAQASPLPAEKLLATTEFKINLENFDMEYVLRVQ